MGILDRVKEAFGVGRTLWQAGSAARKASEDVEILRGQVRALEGRLNEARDHRPPCSACAEGHIDFQGMVNGQDFIMKLNPPGDAKAWGHCDGCGANWWLDGKICPVGPIVGTGPFDEYQTG